MRFVTSILALVGAAVLAAPAMSASVTFSGTGVVGGTSGGLTPTGLVPNGSAFNFSFTFDPDNARLYDSSDGDVIYDLPVSAFSATLGDFVFALSSDPALVPAVELYRGFSFFGGNASEPSIAFGFYLFGTPTTAAQVTPFAGTEGRNQQLAISGIIRDTADGLPLTLASLAGGRELFFQDFEYGTFDKTIRKSGLLRGGYTGGFAPAATAGVPEPSTWALMMLGFGIVGGAMRRRANVRMRVGFA